MHRAISALLTGIFLAVWNLTPARAQESSAEGSPADSVAIQVVGLRWVLEDMDEHSLGPVETVCFVDGNRERLAGGSQERLSPVEVILRNELHLRTAGEGGCVRGSGASVRPDRLFRDPETQAAATFLDVSEPVFTAPDSAIVSLGFHHGPLWGRGSRCQLAREGEEWMIVECKRSWVS